MKEDVVILDNISQGIVLYKLLGTERLKTFGVPHSEHKSQNVAFHDGASTVICESNHGKVYIFDCRTGKINNTIHIGIKEWVQLIASIEVAGILLILVGQSGENIGQTKIQVWEKLSITIA
ncbi:hypothetical protein BT96DRAFT_1004645 [Gymnopus androsaceus JB14]|uniref:WD40 repeat-like protein n=1 Tax=Gymnopus androsaceus JB14 TaxID=1447944 RepID=A0A6A4GRZ1_9AGAR|nr:hypothetical protein BT96DRAFT_1004645 [Gymnopus androsaceus JB14]